MRTPLQNVPSVVASVAIIVVLLQDAPAFVDADTFLGPPSAAFVPRPGAAAEALSLHSRKQLPLVALGQLRGGASSAAAAAIDVEIESSDEEEEADEDDAEEEEPADSRLAKAAQEAVSKVKSRASRAATQAAKAAVTSTLLKSASPSKKKKTNWTRFFHIPYILKACLNPFLFIQMTRGYWASLFNIKYLDETQVRCAVVLLTWGSGHP
jgi:hypothetical protein